MGRGGDYVQMRISSGLQRAGHSLLASGTAGGDGASDEAS